MSTPRALLAPLRFSGRGFRGVELPSCKVDCRECGDRCEYHPDFDRDHPMLCAGCYKAATDADEAAIREEMAEFAREMGLSPEQSYRMGTEAVEAHRDGADGRFML